MKLSNLNDLFLTYFNQLTIFGCHAKPNCVSFSLFFILDTISWRLVVAKGPRVIITLECTEARKEGKSPSRYTTTKNKKTTPDRLELMKYNPFLRRHTLHKEIK